MDANMTYAQAKKLLPKFAVGLTERVPEHCTDSIKVSVLRSAVRLELTTFHLGGNPLEPKQVAALKKFLAVTA